MTDGERDELLTRISAPEHLLEIGYATWMAQMSTVEIAEFGRQFEQRLRTTWPLAVEVFGHRSESSPEVYERSKQSQLAFGKRLKRKIATFDRPAKTA